MAARRAPGVASNSVPSAASPPGTSDAVARQQVLLGRVPVGRRSRLAARPSRRPSPRRIAMLRDPVPLLLGPKVEPYGGRGYGGPRRGGRDTVVEGVPLVRRYLFSAYFVHITSHRYIHHVLARTVEDPRRGRSFGHTCVGHPARVSFRNEVMHRMFGHFLSSSVSIHVLASLASKKRNESSRSARSETGAITTSEAVASLFYPSIADMRPMRVAATVRGPPSPDHGAYYGALLRCVAQGRFL